MLVNRVLMMNTSECRFPDDLSQLFNAPSWDDPELQHSKQLLNEVTSRLDTMQHRWGGCMHGRRVGEECGADEATMLLSGRTQ